MIGRSEYKDKITIFEEKGGRTRNYYPIDLVFLKEETDSKTIVKNKIFEVLKESLEKQKNKSKKNYRCFIGLGIYEENFKDFYIEKISRPLILNSVFRVYSIFENKVLQYLNSTSAEVVDGLLVVFY